MGFRFRKSIKIVPGLKINLSKTGTSLSIGKPGMTVNVSKKGTRTTVGMPGTGLSYSSYAPHNNAKDIPEPAKVNWVWLIGLGALLIVAIILFNQ